MPDYIPQPRLPEGMAQQLGQMAMQKAMIIPQALQSGLKDFFAQLAQQQQQRQEQTRQNLTPLQMQWLQSAGQAPFGQKMEIPKKLFPQGLTPAAQKMFETQQQAFQKKAGETVRPDVFDLIQRASRGEEVSWADIPSTGINPAEAELFKSAIGQQASRLITEPSQVQALAQRYEEAYGKPWTSNVMPISVIRGLEEMEKQKAKPGPATQLSEEQINENVKSMMEGMPLSKMPGSKSSQALKINAAYSKEREKNPLLPSSWQLEKFASAEIARIKTLNSTQMTQELAGINQFREAAKLADESMKKLDQSDFPLLNKLEQLVGMKVYEGTDYAENVKIAHNALVEMAQQGSRVFSGTAQTDSRFRADLDRLSGIDNYRVFKAGADALVQIAGVREQTLLEMPSFLPGGEKVVQPQAAPPKAEQPKAKPTPKAQTPKTPAKKESGTVEALKKTKIQQEMDADPLMQGFNPNDWGTPVKIGQ